MLDHDCIANSVVESSEKIGVNTVRRKRICKKCSRVYSVVETFKGMATQSRDTQVKIDKIIRNVCTVFNVTKKDLISKKRPKRLALIRHVAMYLCREAGYSYPKIARVFDRHHATIIYGCRHVEKKIDEDPELRKFVLLARFHHSDQPGEDPSI